MYVLQLTSRHQSLAPGTEAFEQQHKHAFDHRHKSLAPGMAGMGTTALPLESNGRASAAGSVFSEYSEEGPHHHHRPSVEGNLKLYGQIPSYGNFRDFLVFSECSTDIMCCRFSYKGQHLAVGLIDGTIKIYETDPLTLHCLYSLQDKDTSQKHLPVTQIRFQPHDPDAKIEWSHILIASYASGQVKFWHYTSGNCLQTIDEPHRQILTLSINPENTKFITAGDDCNIHLYDMQTKKVLQKLGPSDSRDQMDGHKMRVFSTQYHPNPIHYAHHFLSGGWDNTVHFWDDRVAHSVRRLSGPHICGDALDIDAQHNHILTGSWRTENTLQVWNYADGERICEIPQDKLSATQVYCCQWLGSDSIICGGASQNLTKLIDRGTLNTTGQLVDLPKSVYCLDNTRHGNHPLIAVGSANRIYLIKEEKSSSRDTPLV